MKKRQKIRSFLVLFMFLMFPIIINYLSPVLIIGGASQGIITGSFILFAVLFIGSLFFGRFWCGWICPASGLQQSCQPFTDRKAKNGIGSIIRWIMWSAWLGMIVFLFIKAGNINAIDPFYNTEQIISILDPIIVIVYFSVVLTILIMTLAFGNRAFCKYLCWMAPFMIISNKIRYAVKLPGVYLKAESDKCIGCKQCNKVCPMNIDVEKCAKENDFSDGNCIMCYQCVDVCPKDVIK